MSKQVFGALLEGQVFMDWQDKQYLKLPQLRSELLDVEYNALLMSEPVLEQALFKFERGETVTAIPGGIFTIIY